MLGLVAHLGRSGGPSTAHEPGTGCCSVPPKPHARDGHTAGKAAPCDGSTARPASYPTSRPDLSIVPGGLATGTQATRFSLFPSCGGSSPGATREGVSRRPLVRVDWRGAVGVGQQLAPIRLASAGASSCPTNRGPWKAWRLSGDAVGRLSQSPTGSPHDGLGSSTRSRSDRRRGRAVAPSSSAWPAGAPRKPALLKCRPFIGSTGATPGQVSARAVPRPVRQAQRRGHLVGRSRIGGHCGGRPSEPILQRGAKPLVLRQPGIV